MDAYAGTILYADLSSGTLDARPFPDDLKRTYLGGRGIGSRIISELIDPLAPGNVSVIATGPLTGSGVPLGSRYEVITKSPLNNTLTSANSGGVFGWKMTKAGFDAVVVTGKAEKPVYILLNGRNSCFYRAWRRRSRKATRTPSFRRSAADECTGIP
jgi:aldehyde:ferredoxin oxidoreductase